MTETDRPRLSRRQFAAVVGVSAVVGAALVTAWMSAARPGSEWGPEPGQFHSRTYGFSIQFPAAWQAKEDYMGCAVIGLRPLEGASDRFAENVSVVVSDVAEGTPPEAYADAQLPRMRTMLAGFAEGERSTVSPGGSPAARRAWRHSMGDQPLSVVSYTLTKGPRAYTITCTAAAETADAWLPKLEAVAQTFRME